MLNASHPAVARGRLRKRFVSFVNCAQWCVLLSVTLTCYFSSRVVMRKRTSSDPSLSSVLEDLLKKCHLNAMKTSVRLSACDHTTTQTQPRINREWRFSETPPLRSDCWIIMSIIASVEEWLSSHSHSQFLFGIARWCAHAHTNAHAQAHKHIQMHKHTCTHKHTQMHKHTHTHTDTQTLTHTYTHTYKRRCSHTHKHTSTHAHTQPVLRTVHFINFNQCETENCSQIIKWRCSRHEPVGGLITLNISSLISDLWGITQQMLGGTFHH